MRGLKRGGSEKLPILESFIIGPLKYKTSIYFNLVD
jgi:hypothetical protein